MPEAAYPYLTAERNHGVGYVYLRAGDVARTVELAEDVYVDLDREGQALGVELLSLPELNR